MMEGDKRYGTIHCKHKDGGKYTTRIIKRDGRFYSNDITHDKNNKQLAPLEMTGYSTMLLNKTCFWTITKSTIPKKKREELEMWLVLEEL